MKPIIFILVTFGLFACNQQAENTQLIQNRIDSLESKLADAYKPGFGDFMSGIQTHHSKLWFAGQSYNWKLADFEVHEIMEAIVDIQKYQTERKECQLIGMINPALDSMNIAIQQRNLAFFDRSYIFLTNTCNNCHRATNFEFNVVKIPDNQPFSNQEFKVKKDAQ
jgi:hypothetical protein